MPTDLKQEAEEQRRWRLRTEAMPFAGFYARLLSNEFLPPPELEARQSVLLRRMLAHAAEQVPYYRTLAESLGLDLLTLGCPADLAVLPILSKAILASCADDLVARALPPGEKVYGWFSSSGTTGRPARVLQTRSSNLMFGLLSQRHHRWFRFDPLATMATIRLASQNPRLSGGLLPAGATLRRPYWRYSGQFFKTGPNLFFNIENPVGVQLAWLEKFRPDYLVTYSESLEHLGLACMGRWPVPGIRKLLAISEQLTPSMRRYIEKTLGAPVVQSYGLNEAGLVAIGCEAGRYHWHVEHCIVEVVDADGQPCRPGERGRVLVTTLRNPAMPLLRYDTGDVAQAVAGPCPCGRTLPAFGQIAGRYSRIAFLPESTLPKVGLVRATLEEMPLALIGNLRQFQVHQYRDGRFELRILCAGAMPPEFGCALLERWNRDPVAVGTALDIVVVERIERSPGGKFQDFTSDFMPGPDYADAQSAAPADQ